MIRGSFPYLTSAQSIACWCCSTPISRWQAPSPLRPRRRRCGKWRCATLALISCGVMPAADIEYGVKCARGLQNVLMDIGGNEATNGYTEMLVRYLGAGRVVFGSDATGRSFTSQLAKVYGADIAENERKPDSLRECRGTLCPVAVS